MIIGHNADIAWGFTNLGPDVTDLYVERVRGDEWFRDGEWQPLKTRTETIEVAGGDDETIEVRSTTHGPLLSDVADDLAGRRRRGADVDRDRRRQRRGLRPRRSQWTALQPGRTADAIFDLNRASNWDEFREAVSSFEVPSQNLVYADREGHIGYQAPGRIPIRKSGNDGRMPAAGWLPENDWTGDYVPVRRSAAHPGPGRRRHRHRQPGRDRRGLPVLPHRRLGPGLPVRSGSATCWRRRTRGRSTT